MSSTAGRIQERALGLLANIAPTTSAQLDWLRSSNHQSWGGPMNGQAGRQSLIRQIARSAQVTAVVETGTYRGTTTLFLWHVIGAPVFSVEISRRFHHFARRRFADIPGIRVDLDDSVNFLRRLAADPSVPKQGVLFYFDAHWGRDIPLRQELQLVHDHWTDSIVIVDDFEVPADAGYGYDDYGPGRALTREYLATSASASASFTVLYPALPSDQETGARRGCCVLTNATCAEHLLRCGVGLVHDPQPVADAWRA